MRGVSVESNRPRSREMQTPVPTTANHQRNLSSESRQATLVPGITHPPPAVLVHNAGQANDSNNSSNRNSSRNSNGNNNKPEIVTTTIYYHDALMKAQQQQLSPRVQEQTNDELLTSTTIYYQDGLMKQQQQQQQHLRVQEQPSNDPLTSTTIYYHDGLMKAQQQQQRQQREREREQTNDDLLRSIESVSSSTTQCASVPQRTFSQSSSYSTTPGHKRSASQASTRALIPTSSRHNRANRSVDYPRPSRDYPSFRQEAAYMPDMPEVQRPFSSRSNYENRHHRQHSQSQSAINDSSNWAPSDMMQERSSIESDREMIQIAYVRNVAENEPTYNDSKFYEDLGRAHSVNTAAPGPRPFSPFSQLNHY
ncbi:hypothetical protein B0O80DRAFT_288530 [Mortierella sp. GBAus27b]|nr:hypothetical protein B0O80DRAFT_288530 [Mortierella sp. GBAus27b]